MDFDIIKGLSVSTVHPTNNILERMICFIGQFEQWLLNVFDVKAIPAKAIPVTTLFLFSPQNDRRDRPSSSFMNVWEKPLAMIFWDD